MDDDGFTGHAQALRHARKRFRRAGKRMAQTILDRQAIAKYPQPVQHTEEVFISFIAAYKALMAVE